MRKRIAYWIERKSSSGLDCSQYLLPNELYLIKTMLNDGDIISGVRKDELTEAEYKSIFG